ncbi:DsrE family protein [Campylobacter sp. RM15925]|uniref:DsrE family protein n=1 Tax=Campylobacter sp. RM15925 TaxID=1705724 RepID=UPI0014730D5B|nr:DsrE family protein [Campylobacter sp. RM15925]
MLNKTLLNLALGSALATALYASGDEIKGLNVMLTASDTQTQMMAMVLSTKTLEQKKDVRIVLCSEAGDLALKESKSEPQKPLNKSPKDLLQGAIKNGASVKVCPLYLPNKGLDKSALIEGVEVASPDEVAKSLLDGEYKNLSY